MIWTRLCVNRKRAVTDSEAQILYRDEQPGVKNLINIYSACTGKTPDEVVKEFDGKGYGDFKMAVGRVCLCSSEASAG